jgi:hypothetical protein
VAGGGGGSALKRRWFVVGLLVPVFVVAWLGVLRVRVIDMNAYRWDPAVPLYTKHNSDAFAGIDRWSHQGLPLDAIAARLKGEGYECRMPQDRFEGGTPRWGEHEMMCARPAGWPLARTLEIRVRGNYEIGGRFVSARAETIFAGKAKGWRHSVARPLRALGLMEPDQLAVKGLSFSNVDPLARFVLDGLRRDGWGNTCTEGSDVPICPATARDRAELGFAPLPLSPIMVYHLESLRHSFARIGFVPREVAQRKQPFTVTLSVPDGGVKIAPKPRNIVVLRVTNGQLWADFEGRDPAGTAQSVSVRVAMEGGQPLELVVRMGEAAKTFPLAGQRMQRYADGIDLLVPRAEPETDLPEDMRRAVWLFLPLRTDAERRLVAAEMPQLHPAFAAPVLRALLEGQGERPRVDDQLGLNPRLQTIERRADALRAARVAEWLDVGTRFELLGTVYKDDAAARAAWALAVCEQTDERPPVMNVGCWTAFTLRDPAAAALVKGEVTEQEAFYASLPARHPVRRRLKRLIDAFAAAG